MTISRLNGRLLSPGSAWNRKRGNGNASAAPILHCIVIIGALCELDRWRRIEDETSVTLASNNAFLVHDANVIG